MADTDSPERGKILQRIKFLSDRAQSHMMERAREGSIEEWANATQQTWRLDQLAAATCLREAAILALIVERYSDAQKYFHEAGKLAISQGVWEGYLLFELGRKQRDDGWWIDRPNDLNAIDAISSGFERSQSQPDEPHPDYSGLIDPTRALSVFQSLLFYPHDEASMQVLMNLRELLSRWAGVSVGSSGVPIQSYLAVLDLLFPGEVPKRSNPLSPVMAFESILLRHREWILSAQANQYQWENLVLPIDFIDPNILSLAALAKDHGLLAEVEERLREQVDQITLWPIQHSQAVAPPVPSFGRPFGRR